MSADLESLREKADYARCDWTLKVNANAVFFLACLVLLPAVMDVPFLSFSLSLESYGVALCCTFKNLFCYSGHFQFPFYITLSNLYFSDS